MPRLLVTATHGYDNATRAGMRSTFGPHAQLPFERAPGPGGGLVARFDVVLAADGRFGRRTREYDRLVARV